jgi:hypothetical protein
VKPTAVHAVAESQDTAHRPVCSSPPNSRGKLGVGWIAHRFPFHRSTNVVPEPPPTAVQTVREAHDTADSELSGENRPFRSGVGWIAQLVPFQRSANVASLP